MTPIPRPKRPVVRLATICSIGLVAALAATGPAAAEPAADPHQFSDRTVEFVPIGHPEAMAAHDAGKQLVLSPYNTRRSIVCRGNGGSVPYYDCAQEDGLGWAPLHRSETPVGEVWIYFP